MTKPSARPPTTLKGFLLGLLKGVAALGAGVGAAAVFNLAVQAGPWLINPPAPCPAGATCFPTPAFLLQLTVLATLSFGALVAVFYAPCWKILRKSGRQGPGYAVLLGLLLTLAFWIVLNGWPADPGEMSSTAQYSLSGGVGALAAWFAERRLNRTGRV